MIRLWVKGETAFLAGERRSLRGCFLVMRDPLNGDHGDGCHCGENDSEHDDDEYRGAVCGLGRGLSDPHGVDEGVRDEEEKLHGIGPLLDLW